MANWKIPPNVLNFVPFVRDNIYYTVFYDDEECIIDVDQVESAEVSVCNSVYKCQSKSKNFNFLKTKKFIKLQSSKLRSSKKCSTIWQTFQYKLENISQKFRTSKKEAEIKTPGSLTTPNRRTRHILGRTPIKLYSPFAIETPERIAWCSNINLDDNTPIRCGALKHLEKAKRKNNGKYFFRRLVGKNRYYNF